jgi:azurin
VRKAAAQVLPVEGGDGKEEGGVGSEFVRLLRDAGLLEDPDPLTRLAALLRLTEVAPSDELGAMLYDMSTAPEVVADQWLADAVYVAAAHHLAGFLQAYQEALGDEAFSALADTMVEEEMTPRRYDLSTREGWEASEAALAAAAARPAAERLLRAYLEEVVGPFDRAQVERGWFGGQPSDEPVLEITISALEGQLKFDVTHFEVKPRQRVRLTFVNPDLMQHNLLLLRPGTTEAVGALADALLATPDAADRGYVPPTPDVIRYTPLVEPGETTVLEFTAPRDTGEYPYICTFPGHWRVMQGVMSVNDE